jgi:hypothetical protein
MLIPEFRHYYMQLRAAHPADYAILYFGPALVILCSAFALRGHNWGRWFLTTWVAFMLVASAWNRNLKAALVDLVWLVAAAYYLFRPLAKAFFTSPFRAVVAQSEKTTLVKPGLDPQRCAECGEVFARENLIHLQGVYVCSRCKPVFLQKLAEGAAVGRVSEDESDA